MLQTHIAGMPNLQARLQESLSIEEPFGWKTHFTTGLAKSANVKWFDVFVLFVLVFNFVLFLQLFLKEQIKILESLKALTPKVEIELMKEKSKAKIEAAKTLQRLIEELKKSKGYLTDEEMKAVEESLKHFQL